MISESPLRFAYLRALFFEHDAVRGSHLPVYRTVRSPARNPGAG